jgi:TRAP-type C4-dicarboxylate transport system substrate-binding protein
MREFHYKATRDAAEKSLAELKAKGMQFNEIAPAEYERMQAATKSVMEKFAADYDQTKVKLFNEELARIRASVK